MPGYERTECARRYSVHQQLRSRRATITLCQSLNFLNPAKMGPHTTTGGFFYLDSINPDDVAFGNHGTQLMTFPICLRDTPTPPLRVNLQSARICDLQYGPALDWYESTLISLIARACWIELAAITSQQHRPAQLQRTFTSRRFCAPDDRTSRGPSQAIFIALDMVRESCSICISSTPRMGRLADTQFIRTTARFNASSGPQYSAGGGSPASLEYRTICIISHFHTSLSLQCANALERPFVRMSSST